ncbi:MAG: alpha/beta hydrolase domain-containing protein [Candidatus Binatus sp.]
MKAKLLCPGVLALILLAAGIASTAASAAEPNPTVTGPITGGCSPNCPTPPGPTNGIHVPGAFDGVSNQASFIAADYTEEEYFFSGTATAFEQDPTAPAWTSNGIWPAVPSTTIPTAAYESRMLVRRPTDPSKFNGYVVVEWLNVTAAIDLAPDYGYYQNELLRDGFIWVGVSAQQVGIDGSPFLPGFALKSWDPVRYAPLVHPGDNYCYDIYSQAVQAIRHPAEINPLGSSAYVIKGILADGESQSAGRMVTYYNAIQPLAQLFDGFLIHSTGSTGAALFAGAGGNVPSPSFLRTDQQPVLVFETETDTVGYFAARQANGPTYRLWEGAGTAHVDSYDLASYMSDPVNPEPSYPANSCTFEDNTAHERYLMDAALVRLSQWINGGTQPPTASPIDVVSGVIQRDSFGIALDGIRLPEMDVPTEVEQGVGNSGTLFCFLFGRTLPLPVPLGSLYSNHGKYVSQFAHATNNLEKAGFLLDPDAEEAKTNAGEAAVP